ncbi:hypothetical protein C8Q69DRAFT_472639 [Paecilomyces variotii]|uniref:Uncharacterized protein n=1 Tax=Byssochlamys spectabilis TaxID=264951 RepID=A0A443HQK1_BYSSP|nr:hypothetical protein C8Q69DRAFT_472639 [Paecilomyces variotii]RWQ94096.1 hypothetical protein C8Q69DRAFT_472639 [Paecilomyces variotii]
MIAYLRVSHEALFVIIMLTNRSHSCLFSISGLCALRHYQHITDLRKIMHFRTKFRLPENFQNDECRVLAV